MSGLGRRIYGAAGLLIALQVAGTMLGFASWGAVQRASARQEALAVQRDAVELLGAASREVYVHEAHTLIEGPGHLDHLAEGQAEVDTRLVAVRRLSLPAGADVAGVQAALAASNTWFGTEVVPVARSGALDRALAIRLHGETERRAEAVERSIAAVLTVVDNAAAAERDAVTAATGRAWIAVALLTLGGAGIGMIVASRLVRSVLQPIEQLQLAAAQFGAGQLASGAQARAVEGDDELGRLGKVFNDMVAQVQAAQVRRTEVARLAALGELSGAVAHELMSPLSVLLADPAMQAPELAASRAEAEHARRVVRGLLGFARPGEEPVSEVDVHALAVASGDRYTPLAEQRDVTIRVDLSVDASPAGTGAGLHIRAAASAVRQVLDNLVHNAVLASEPGATVDIVVRAHPTACVEVRDRGPGLPAAVKARLYEPFVTGRADGTGLGLAVCQRIVRANGGVLEHLPRDGGGLIARWTLAAGVSLHSGESNA
jgi:signal transduction histidine kinase